ncbi:hypothetical protein AOL_s00185g3 [Orbilia oligospora ATCC 24927]|uniref:Uncharacterized protein n=1 Tax=Arthrobotrys oligospora (strain ATCC 24927 / CBS 115.81 / DSM 1491) TaxID=756982 RepID=G1XPY8_ARTOA|nr:hypothetical protein AOL_s00185g3 [Orbilia oligospora ATCC 24927]EGX44789.1 hypothetical protein AOL_s00185g3 [Orbilia oligospora ATCC 24927]
MHPTSIATAIAALAIIADPVSAHARCHRVMGDKNPPGVWSQALLAGKKWNPAPDKFNSNDPWNQKLVTIFSDPPVPAWGKKRSWLKDGCGVTLSTVNLWWKLSTGNYGPHRWTQSLAGAKAGKEAYIQTAHETKKQADDGSMAVVSADGTGILEMRFFQINEDGAGPFRCRVDTNGNGTYEGWEPDERFLLQAKPNDKGRSHSFHKPTVGQVLHVKWRVPRGQVCDGKSGKYTGVCILRCENFAKNGPFGGCIPFRVVNVPPPPPNKHVPKPKPIKEVERPEAIEYDYPTEPEQAADGTYYKRDITTFDDPAKIKIRGEYEGIHLHVIDEMRKAKA